MGNFRNLVGMKFNRITVMSFLKMNKYGRSAWNCLCDCGKRIVVDGGSLISNNTKSCGCLNIESRIKTHSKHSMYGTRTYKIWSGIIQRCCNKRSDNYKRYGARGIKVCKRWRNSFINFYKDMGESCNKLQIDRIDNNGNYEPSNCKWSTSKENLNNTRRNIFVVYKGVSKTLSQWSEDREIKYSTLLYRIKSNWNMERAMSSNLYVKQ